MLVSKRRRLLDYLKSHDSDRYRDVIGKLGLRNSGKTNLELEAPRPNPGHGLRSIQDAGPRCI